MPPNFSSNDMHQHVEPDPKKEGMLFDHPAHAARNRRQFLGDTFRGFVGATLAYVNIADADDSPKKPMPVPERHITPEQLALLEKYFEADQEAYDEIARIGFQAYVNEHKLMQKHIVFTRKEAATMEIEFCCSDDGIEDKEHILVRTPGSLMIQAKDRQDKNPLAPDFVLWVAKEVLSQDGTIFAGHKGCGAGKAILAQRMHVLKKIKDPVHPTKEEEAQYLSPDKVDSIVQEFTDLVVAQMKILAPEKADKISGKFIENLARPPNLHPGRCLYLTKIKNLDTTCPGLPRGYVETVLHIDNLADSLDHAEILCDIALGDHGVGPKVTEDPSKQFIICCIGETGKELDLLKRDAQAKIDSLKLTRPNVAKMLRVDGFSLTA